MKVFTFILAALLNFDWENVWIFVFTCIKLLNKNYIELNYKNPTVGAGGYFFYLIVFKTTTYQTVLPDYCMSIKYARYTAMDWFLKTQVERERKKGRKKERERKRKKEITSIDFTVSLYYKRLH